ncbi:lysoplasmalogenase family protein [Sphingopyxis sp. MWB1]|uniref:lysoplasmalogenase family protein n=1 Tax=Sphingopyxis sp. MWB1 TaxID=1537715 RepID=UPI00068EED03|nr:lysoplasmalogenase family protein [Sphingopyxis sp. MWB1]
MSGAGDVAGWDRARWLWWAALAAGASYFITVLMRWDGPLFHLWKASGVALLAAWAAVNARGDKAAMLDGRLIAAALACGALGDWLLDARGMVQGGAAFAVGHGVAIFLYWRNRRAALAPSQRALVGLTVPLALVIVWALARGAPPELAAAAIGYTAIVAVMAAAAWASRFPRYRTGVGAMLFLLSDLIIFAGEGGAMAPDLRAWLVWPLYFGGQALIAWGVVSSLSREGAI